MFWRESLAGRSDRERQSDCRARDIAPVAPATDRGVADLTSFTDFVVSAGALVEPTSKSAMAEENAMQHSGRLRTWARRGLRGLQRLVSQDIWDHTRAVIGGVLGRLRPGTQ